MGGPFNKLVIQFDRMAIASSSETISTANATDGSDIPSSGRFYLTAIDMDQGVGAAQDSDWRSDYEPALWSPWSTRSHSPRGDLSAEDSAEGGRGELTVAYDISPGWEGSRSSSPVRREGGRSCLRPRPRNRLTTQLPRLRQMSNSQGPWVVTPSSTDQREEENAIRETDSPDSRSRLPSPVPYDRVRTPST